MKPCYINSIASISAQNTFENNSLESAIIHTTKTIEATHPNYREFISPALSRRMATGVKMGVTAAKKALKDANISHLDAIITGTGMGCIEDSEKFLTAILEHDEQHLTPTSFIQSTHNTVGAQIALIEKCKGYNVTYVHGAVSFESAVLDAQLMLHENHANTILVGGVDELGKTFVHDVVKLEALQEKGIQIPFSEGAHFFTLGTKKEANSYSKLIDIEVFHSIKQEQLQEKLNLFLTQNGFSFSNIDAILFGKNGDAFDTYYECLLENEHFKTIPQIAYKPFSGEYYTASAFGFWLGNLILKQQQIPESLAIKTNKTSGYKNILLYNQFKGHQHSFILLSEC